MGTDAQPGLNDAWTFVIMAGFVLGLYLVIRWAQKKKP